MRTKHIAIKYHYLQRFVKKNIIQICCIGNIEQTENIFTNPFDEAFLTYIQGKWSGRWKPLLQYEGFLEYTSNSKNETVMAVGI